ncbi:uncharacterized protein C8A04DRAFT_25511 [Dichotomopilus funicola]|uniref:Peptidase metallopeptidase domain-containing protein n=1 Tax=Dichotomopilus funicola TaxID=1934379 RepID=A0AAN6V9Q1_9PEZI|nr:hypothetical protein C8A04DRAFT_25511 [Dichotomopilus funicola]
MSDEVPYYCSAEALWDVEGEEDVDLPVTNLTGGEDGPPDMALDPAWFWKNGEKIKVRFLDGSPVLQARVRTYAEEWEKYANIDFVFVTEGNASIRVRFKNPRDPKDKTTDSQLGTGAKKFVIDQNQPTMRLYSLNDDTKDDEVCRVVLHEFGHALGCVHEHQSLAAKIEWNEEQVFADAKKFYHWDKEKARNQIMKVNEQATLHSSFDPKSIMCYMIPPKWTKNGRGVKKNLTLSETDISFIRKAYPFRTRNAGRLSVVPEIRPIYPPLALNSKVIDFDPPYTATPRVVLGLTLLDASHETNVRVHLHTPSESERGKASFTLNLDAWADTKLYNAAATWLEFSRGEVEYEVGEYNTLDTRPNFRQPALPSPDNPGLRRDISHVDFRKGKYTSPPNILIWLTAFDFDNRYNWRVRAAAHNVTASGFDVVIESWGDTTLYSAAAEWVAYPKDQAGVLSGRVSSNDYRNWFPAQAGNQGKVRFAVPFERLNPKVFMALSELDMDSSRNLRVKVYADRVSSEGFTWHGDAWEDSLLYSVGADWIAFG